MKRTGAFYELIYHFVWGTRHREPLLTQPLQACLFPFLTAKCRELGYTLYAVNGMPDHVHALLGLTPTIVVADVAKNLKGASSHHINQERALNQTLYWQDGYGVITIRAAEIPKIVKYIQNQKQHHAGGHLSSLLERAEQ